MTVFWLVVALFLAGALVFLLPALWSPRAASASLQGANLAVHRDQWAEAERDLANGLISPERLAQVQGEIRRRVLEDSETGEPAPVRPARRTAWALALLIPLASVLTYLRLGQPDAVAPQLRTAATGPRHSVTPEQIQQMATALAERLKSEPQDLEGWLMLGRSYTALGRYGDAVTAFKRASGLGPPDAGVLADLADVTGMAQGRRLAGEPARLIQQALDVDPRHVKALALAGSVAFEARDYAAARGYWLRLVAVVPAESPMARAMQNNIAEATQLDTGGMAAPSTTAAAPDAPTTPTTAPARTDAAPAALAVRGQVQISPEMASRLAPGDTLFVFARAVQGPRMPLAILRVPAQAGAVSFTLDDSMAMAPELRLSGFAQVVVGARVSRRGSATPQAGDLVGQSTPVAPGAAGVQVLIDRVQP
jgi:cytochrome c-type biogenesis protein CcmH